MQATTRWCSPCAFPFALAPRHRDETRARQTDEPQRSGALTRASRGSNPLAPSPGERKRRALCEASLS